MQPARPLQRWWNRPCGGREVVAIALPLVISTGFFSITLFIDRMFLLWHSEAEMASSMPAGMLHWTIVCFPMGVASYANTFVAQYWGAGRKQRIGHVVWQSLRIGFYCTPLFLLSVPLAPTIFSWAGHSMDVYWYEVLYFQVLAFAAGPAVMSASLASFFIGRGETRVVMYINIVSAVVNIGLDYVLIFGHLGVPELGIEGAAWATVASVWCKFLVYLTLFLLPRHRTEFGIIRGRAWDRTLFKRLFWFGAPNGLQFFVESGAFMMVTMKMGQLGTTAMAATTLALNINAVAFIPMLGVGIAVSTLVGQQLTQGRPELARRATWTAVLLAAGYNGVFAMGYLFFPNLLMFGHEVGMNSAHFEEIRKLTVTLLRFVAAYCLLDALQVIFVGAIKGAGDTWFVLLNTAVLSWASVAIGILGESYFEARLLWWWSVVTAWIAALGITFLVRFLRGKWVEMRVIEQHQELDEMEASLEIEIAS